MIGKSLSVHPVLVPEQNSCGSGVLHSHPVGAGEAAMLPPAPSVNGSVPTSTDRWVTFTEGEVSLVPGKPPILLLEGHLDWFAVSFYCGLEDIIAGLRLLYRTSFDDDPAKLFRELAGGRFYARMLLGPGLTIYADCLTSSTRSCHVEMKGEILSQFSISQVIEFVEYVSQFCDVHPQSKERFKCTRLDWAIDHAACGPDEIWSAMLEGNLRTNVRRGKNGWGMKQESMPGMEQYQINDPNNLDPENKGDKFAGKTVYLGSRGAERRLCVYNGRGFNRWEFRATGERSTAICKQLMLVKPEKWGALMLAHLRDFVDFVDRKQQKCISRCPLLNWWAEFVGQAGRALLKLPRVVTDAALRVKGRIKKTLQNFAEMIAVVRGSGVEDDIAGIVERAAVFVTRKFGPRINQQRLALSGAIEGEGKAVFAAMFQTSLLDDVRGTNFEPLAIPF